jgi:hypothetical protein
MGKAEKREPESLVLKLCALAFSRLVPVLVLDAVSSSLDAVSSSTSTANAEYEYEKPRDNADWGLLEARNTQHQKTLAEFFRFAKIG